MHINILITTTTFHSEVLTYIGFTLFDQEIINLHF